MSSLLHSIPPTARSKPCFVSHLPDLPNSFPQQGELRLHEAFVHLEYMVGRGHRRDATQASQLLYDLCRSNKIRKAIRIMELMGPLHPWELAAKFAAFLDRLVWKGLVPNAFTYSFLLEAAYKERGADEAVKLLDEIVEKGGRPNLLLYEMTKDGFTPDSYTNSSSIEGLFMKGMLDEAFKAFEMMEEHGNKPDIDNYNALILGLFKTRRTDLSFDIYKTMIEKGCCKYIKDAKHNMVL
ncbi:hypothetical protein OPV22_016964 [Ensete ventricosum]|uniref:Pentacotripeptide-repeat region of PRORP domain-containing protein n=1 Tax=Ensete ventricosum TaxID=4639 RepID=A0AAV8QM98_ENSVE|nr:hypothetical protein OPV22_016964 [Ensete ventricosum]